MISRKHIQVHTYVLVCNNVYVIVPVANCNTGAIQLMLQLRLKRLTRFALFRLLCFVAGAPGKAANHGPSSGRGADGAHPESRETFDPLADGETTLRLERCIILS